jgi:hypothetical protein
LTSYEKIARAEIAQEKAQVELAAAHTVWLSSLRIHEPLDHQSPEVEKRKAAAEARYLTAKIAVREAEAALKEAMTPKNSGPDPTQLAFFIANLGLIDTPGGAEWVGHVLDGDFSEEMFTTAWQDAGKDAAEPGADDIWDVGPAGRLTDDD